MILLCGIPSETTLARVADALRARGVPTLEINQRHVRHLRLELSLGDSGLGGRLRGPGYDVDLDDVQGVYLRLMDDRQLPELADEPEDSALRRSSRAFHDHFGHWAEICPGCIVNRYSAMGSNFSKPYQSQLIAAAGFDVPETLITNDPDAVDDFAAEHGGVIYKSISGERSIVGMLDPDDRERLEQIRWCPVQFQAFVDGPNVRVHTVGEEVFATIVDSEAVDYRYASRQTGAAARFAPYTLPEEVAQRCVALASELGLEVAGLDLKLPPDGRVVCLEVNPSPVFSYFEAHTGQPIADAVARLMAGGRSVAQRPTEVMSA